MRDEDKKEDKRMRDEDKTRKQENGVKRE